MENDLMRDFNTSEKVQKRATKMESVLENVQYEERLKHFNLTTFKTRGIRSDLIDVFKIFKGIVDLPIDYLFQRCPLEKSQLPGHFL